MRIVWLIVGLLFLITLRGTLYIVQEPEQVIITQFGKPIGNPITQPGLHVKIPFVQKVHRFDKRFLEWDGDPNQLPTEDKRFIWVDMYARWRISDPLLFFQRLRDERGAQTRLDDILDGETRNAIANHALVEVVRSTNRTPQSSELEAADEVKLSTISFGRDKIRQEILAKAQERTSDLGIEILDVQFKRINYVEEVQKNVYERMIAERRRIADRFRSEGEGVATETTVNVTLLVSSPALSVDPNNLAFGRINGGLTSKGKTVQLSLNTGSASYGWNVASTASLFNSNT